MEAQIENLQIARKEPSYIRTFLTSNAISIIMGAAGTLIWVALFGLGMLINSELFRKQVEQDFNWYAFIMSLLTYTPTNIFLLCMASAFTGGCASRLVVTGAKKIMSMKETDSVQKLDDSAIFLHESPFSSMLRGVVVYFAFLAGVLVASSNLFFEPTPQGYTQAAGVVSFLSFLVGYDPTMFSSFLKVANKVQGK
jgi:hypothetical protein